MNNQLFDITGATLLSIEEASEYLTYKERKYDFWWWLRSPGDDSDCAANVDTSGSISDYGNLVSYGNVYVRPALQIKNLKSTNLLVGDTFRIIEYEFKVISNDLAWMYDSHIGQYPFNKNSEGGNDYNTSDIKWYVDKWFNAFIKPYYPYWIQEL